MLFVYDHQCKIFKRDLLGDQRVRTDYKSIFPSDASAKKFGTRNFICFFILFKSKIMLLLPVTKPILIPNSLTFYRPCQNAVPLKFRRRHQCRLVAAFTVTMAEIIATRVFPEPTSPSNSLFIGSGRDISLMISQEAIFCPFVILKGKLFTNFV